jgi:hypothetical protein
LREELETHQRLTKQAYVLLAKSAGAHAVVDHELLESVAAELEVVVVVVVVVVVACAVLLCT